MSGEVKPFYALYVEKEMVGKRIQNTKVKVTWKFACGENLLTQEIQLKHSLISGKREIRLNGNVVFCSKKSSDKSQPFRKSLAVLNTTATVHVEDGPNGYVYDLLLDGMPFHKTNRISVTDLEKLRQQKKERKKRISTHRISYSDFVGKETSSTSATAPPRDLLSKETAVPEEDLLGDLSSSNMGPSATTAGNSSGLGLAEDVFGSTSNPNVSNPWSTFEATPAQPPAHQTQLQNNWSTAQNTSDFNPFDDQPTAPLTDTSGFLGAQPANDYSFASGISTQQQPSFSVQHAQYQPQTVGAPQPTTTTDSIAQQLQSLDFGSPYAAQPAAQEPYNGNGVTGLGATQQSGVPTAAGQLKPAGNGAQGYNEYQNLVDLNNLSTGQGKF